MTSLSVVMPVFNEAAYLPATIEALVEAVRQSDFDVELVLVDDGSTDGSAAVAERTLADRLALRVLAQPNRGRFEARRAGLQAAHGEWALLLDGRVRLHVQSLAYVGQRLDGGRSVWNGHVDVETAGSPYGAFWKVLVEIAWREYFDDPRETSYDAESFDRYPKGTTCFLAPREVLLDALGAFRSRYTDNRDANDDTPLLRWIAGRERINLSPSFRCDYSARGTLRSFLHHAVHRGTVFLDGHGRRESRFFPAVVTFFPVSGALALAVLRRPAVLPVLVVGGSLVAGAVAAQGRGRPRFETVAFAALTPLYAVAHGFGMWRGLVRLAIDRVA